MLNHPGGVIAVLYRQRGLLAVLVERELTARYRGTLLGYFWSLLNPLLLLAVYSVVFTVIIPARVPVQVPYPLFLFAGLLPWLFASGALLDSAIVIRENGPLLKKVLCPPEVFPAVTVLSHLVHHLLALPILLVGMLVGSFMGWMRFPWTVVFLPLVLVLWAVAVTGLVLAVAALAAHFRDLKDLLHNLLNLVFFTTPIIYSPEIIPIDWLRRAVMLNPVTPLISLYRNVVLLGQVPSLRLWLAAVAVACFCWLLGAFVFTRLRETLAEVV